MLRNYIIDQLYLKISFHGKIINKYVMHIICLTEQLCKYEVNNIKQSVAPHCISKARTHNSTNTLQGGLHLKYFVSIDSCLRKTPDRSVLKTSRIWERGSKSLIYYFIAPSEALYILDHDTRLGKAIKSYRFTIPASFRHEISLVMLPLASCVR